MPAEHVPLDANGVPAVPGTPGRWLTQNSDLLGSDDAVTRQAREGEALSIRFPHGWPIVFKESAALKGLVKALNGSRARAIGSPSADDAATISSIAADGLLMQPLHSFANAERLISSVPGWQIVKGFQIFEQADAAEGAAFVAIRHWWVARPDKVWVDPTPLLTKDPVAGEDRRLLVESKLGEKPMAPLTVAGREVARHIARRLLAGQQVGSIPAWLVEAELLLESGAPSTAGEVRDEAGEERSSGGAKATVGPGTAFAEQEAAEGDAPETDAAAEAEVSIPCTNSVRVAAPPVRLCRT